MDSKIVVSDLNKIKFFLAVNFFQFFVIQTLYLDRYSA